MKTSLSTVLIHLRKKNQVSKLINDAYAYAEFLVRNSKDLVIEGADILKKQKVMKAEELIELMNEKYTTVLNLKI